MGSVIDETKCPVCSKDAFFEYYYKTGEEFIVCEHCGYRKTFFIKEEKRNVLIKDIEESCFELKEVTNPYGCFKYKFKDDDISSFSALETQDAMPSINEFVEENKDKLEYAKFSKFENGEILETNML